MVRWKLNQVTEPLNRHVYRYQKTAPPHHHHRQKPTNLTQSSFFTLALLYLTYLTLFSHQMPPVRPHRDAKQTSFTPFHPNQPTHTPPSLPSISSSPPPPSPTTTVTISTTVFTIKSFSPNISHDVYITVHQTSQSAYDLCCYLLQAKRVRDNLLMYIRYVPAFQGKKVYIYHPLLHIPLPLTDKRNDDLFCRRLRMYFRQLPSV